jgi:hypothetical protein
MLSSAHVLNREFSDDFDMAYPPFMPGWALLVCTPIVTWPSASLPPSLDFTCTQLCRAAPSMFVADCVVKVVMVYSVLLTWCSSYAHRLFTFHRCVSVSVAIDMYIRYDSNGRHVRGVLPLNRLTPFARALILGRGYRLNA